VSVPANFLLLRPMGALLGTPAPPKDFEDFAGYIATFQMKDFIGPLVAHWNGALCGALAASYFYRGDSKALALGVAAFVFVGGVLNYFMLPGQPVAFLCIDLLGYFPAGYLGFILAQKLRGKHRNTE